MGLSAYRKSVDTYAPWLGNSFRKLRDVAVNRRRRTTPFGFSLAGSAIMASGTYEEEFTRVFLNELERHDAVIDIGANVGFYACLAASRQKRVIAFEPLGRNLNYLLDNLWTNRFVTAEVYPVGVGKNPGLLPIYGTGGSASFVQDWAQASRSTFSVVPVFTLDSIIAANLQPNERVLVKMDVEGLEADILSGASAILGRRPMPTWMVEIHLTYEAVPGGVNTRFAETFDYFWRHGYACKKLGADHQDVTEEDVNRWVTRRQVEPGTPNFVFFERNG